MDDPIARLRAEMDQAGEGIKEFAGIVWTFYAELVAKGFTPDQALILCGEYLRTSLINANSGDDE